MTMDVLKDPKGRDTAERLRLWLLRLASLAMFALGVAYWVRLVGVFGGPLWRFDLMPVPWRIAAPALAVLYPIAGVGLWMLVSWGVVVWVVVALVEAFMVLAMPSVFGGSPLILAGHAFGLGLLALLAAGSRWPARPRNKV